jgi:hypothetical protein
MREVFSSRVRLVLIELWLAATIVLLLIATAAALRDPTLRIEIGLLDTRGLPLVWATTLPAICGIVALLGVFQRRPSAPLSLLLYSLYWLVIFAGGMVADVWSSGLAGIARLNVHTWLVGGVMFAVMIAGFGIMAHWSLQHLPGRSPGEPDPWQRTPREIRR